MKRALVILTWLQVSSAVAMGGLWSSELGRQDHPLTWALMGLWAITNLPGIVAAIPIGVLLSPGFVHADSFDGFAGYLVIVGGPTCLSLLISWFILGKIRNS